MEFKELDRDGGHYKKMSTGGGEGRQSGRGDLPNLLIAGGGKNQLTKGGVSKKENSKIFLREEKANVC